MNAYLRLACWSLPLIVASISTATCAGLLPERIARAAREHVDSGQFPALVIGYVDGDKSETTAYGKLDNGKAPDADTVFEIGSITKTFTATLLADAVQSGALKLDDSVSSLLPEFKIPARNGKQITLLQLAEQHSGLPRLPVPLTPADPENPYADYDVAKLREFLAGYSLPRDPGASYEYSNLGFGLLGYALAQHAHSGYSGLLEQKILRPLQMNMTGTTFTDAMSTHLALGHGDDGKRAKNWDFDVLAGCGAIRSNTTDMLKYLKANMSRRSTGLGAAMRMAQEPRIPITGSNFAAGARIGLAWMSPAGDPTSVTWHNGGTGGYRSFIGFTTDGKRGVVIMTNSTTGVDELGFATLVADYPIVPAHKIVAIDAATRDDYSGDYQLADNFVITIARKDDAFYAQATGQSAFPIFPTGKDEFSAKVAGISISFKRDANAKVDSLVLHQNGDRSAPRMGAGEVSATAHAKAVALDVATLAGYIGKFQLAPNMQFEFTLKDSQLVAQLTGQPAYVVYASARDKFFYTVVDAQLEFERDATGKVVAVVLHQNGQTPRAPRVEQ